MVVAVIKFTPILWLVTHTCAYFELLLFYVLGLSACPFVITLLCAVCLTKLASGVHKVLYVKHHSVCEAVRNPLFH